MEIGIGLLDQGMSYVQQGLEFIRSILTTVAGWLPLNPELSVSIIFLLASLFIGHFIAKKFVVRPFTPVYIIWTLIIAISIFLNLIFRPAVTLILCPCLAYNAVNCCFLVDLVNMVNRL